MKRFRFVGVGVTVLAAFALSAIVVTSAVSAAPTFLLAEWLENGVGITETILFETTTMTLLGNKNAPIIKTEASVECSEIVAGTLGPDGAEEIMEMFTLARAAVSSTALSGTSLSCTDEHDCESSKVWRVNMPWLKMVELWEEGTESGFVTLTIPHTGGGPPGWYLECTLLGVKASEECTSPLSVSEVVNVTGGVEVISSEAFTLLMEAKPALCSGNKEETGVIEGKGIEATSLAGPLTDSE